MDTGRTAPDRRAGDARRRRPGDVARRAEHAGGVRVTFDPATPRTFYLGTVRLFRYNRPVGGGWGFSQVASAIHPDFHALVHDALGDLWTASDGGINTRRCTA